MASSPFYAETECASANPPLSVSVLAHGPLPKEPFHAETRCTSANPPPSLSVLANGTLQKKPLADDGLGCIDVNYSFISDESSTSTLYAADKCISKYDRDSRNSHFNSDKRPLRSFDLLGSVLHPDRISYELSSSEVSPEPSLLTAATPGRLMLIDEASLKRLSGDRVPRLSLASTDSEEEGRLDTAHLFSPAISQQCGEIVRELRREVR